jgi:hypothetical protein
MSIQPQQSNPNFQGQTPEYFHEPTYPTDNTELLVEEALRAYEPQPESARGLGAAATQNQPVSASVTEQTVAFEKIELTLEQLGHNIEAMRKDAINKTVNPSVTIEDFETAPQLNMESQREYTRTVKDVNLSYEVTGKSGDLGVKNDYDLAS